MATQVVYVSDVDDTRLEESDVVTITVARQGEEKVMHVSEDQFADLLDEAETLSAMYLSD